MGIDGIAVTTAPATELAGHAPVIASARDNESRCCSGRGGATAGRGEVGTATGCVGAVVENPDALAPRIAGGDVASTGIEMADTAYRRSGSGRRPPRRWPRPRRRSGSDVGPPGGLGGSCSRPHRRRHALRTGRVHPPRPGGRRRSAGAQGQTADASSHRPSTSLSGSLPGPSSAAPRSANARYARWWASRSACHAWRACNDRVGEDVTPGLDNASTEPDIVRSR